MLCEWCGCETATKKNHRADYLCRDALLCKVSEAKAERDDLLAEFAKAIEEKCALELERDALATSDVGLRGLLLKASRCLGAGGGGPAEYMLLAIDRDIRAALTTPPSPAVERVQAVIAAARTVDRVLWEHSALWISSASIDLGMLFAEEMVGLRDALAALDRKEVADTG